MSLTYTCNATLQGNCMYVKFSYEALSCYGGNDIHTGPKWYNPVLHPYNPIMWSYIVSFIQASSHMFVPQLPPFITGVTHWESVYIFLFRYVQHINSA